MIDKDGVLGGAAQAAGIASTQSIDEQHTSIHEGLLACLW
jgi:hypothetical protein